MATLPRRWRPAALAAALAAACAPAPPLPPQADLLIAGGEVHDGSERPGFIGDVAVTGDRVVFVGDAARAGVRAARTIDARGLVVAPGLIDPHTHAGSDLESAEAAKRLNLNYLTQGVTTVFIGNDGNGEPDVAANLGALEAAGVGTNVASFVGFGAVRKRVVGEAARAPSPAELQRMRGLVAQGMCQGAVGFSTGLYYAPQSYAATEEVIALAREAAGRGGLYESHLRDEGSDNVGVMAAVGEALRIGREAGLPVHLAHIKVLGEDVRGRAGEVIALVEAERAAGRRVTADQYPWRASGTRFSGALVPRWAMDGGREAMLTRLADDALRARLRTEMADNLRRRGGPESLLVTTGPYAGRTLARIAADGGRDPLDAAIQVIRQGDFPIASFNMGEADIRAFRARPWVVTSSDGTDGHPRKYASFPRTYADHVRGSQLLTVSQFVRRSSGLTADIFGIEGRGYLRPRGFADVVVFDPRTYDAKADYERPQQLSTGVRWLLVNGAVAIEDSAPVQRLAGVALRKQPPATAECP